jgi:penicillin V acylase-like amidase (Ntn superfamily)
MKTHSIAFLIILSLFACCHLKLEACTTFTISKDSSIVFGRNFDFPLGEGHIHVNKRNQKKSAFIMPPEEPMCWISKFGSITFNQAGKEFPYGGINEAGLVIEQMWLSETIYPEKDHRYGLSELQWIQYQLDMAATVDEVIASDSMVRISYLAFSKLHFLVSDASGKSAVIEYLNGKISVKSGKNLPHAVLANCPYERSIRYINATEDSDKATFSDWTKNSSGRFLMAANMVHIDSIKAPLITHAFEILDLVSQGTSTQWSIVYDISKRKIHYKTLEFDLVQTISLSDFDFSCNANSLYIGITEKNISCDDFKIYSYAQNLEAIKHTVAHVEFLNNSVPQEYVYASAHYPETIFCAE